MPVPGRVCPGETFVAGGRMLTNLYNLSLLCQYIAGYQDNEWRTRGRSSVVFGVLFQLEEHVAVSLAWFGGELVVQLRTMWIRKTPAESCCIGIRLQ
jgi:hypothetical protein